jgi:hypothetical protein
MRRAERLCAAALVIVAPLSVAHAEPLPNTHVTMELRRTIGGQKAKQQLAQVWTGGQRAHVRSAGEDHYYDFAANTVIVLSEGSKIAIRNPIADDPASLFGPVSASEARRTSAAVPPRLPDVVTWKRGPDRTILGRACEAWIDTHAAKARSERCLWRGVPLFLQLDLQPQKMGKRALPGQTRTYEAVQVEPDQATDGDLTPPKGLEVRDAPKGGGG